MQIAVTFRHLDANEGVKGYVKEKVEKVQKYIEIPQEVHVVLSTEKFRHIAELTVIADGMTFNSQGRDNDLYAAIDQMVDRMERQIRERREKGRRKRTNLTTTETPVEPTDEFAEGGGERGARVKRREAFAKPMSPEEASPTEERTMASVSNVKVPFVQLISSTIVISTSFLSPFSASSRFSLPIWINVPKSGRRSLTASFVTPNACLRSSIVMAPVFTRTVPMRTLLLI